MKATKTTTRNNYIMVKLNENENSIIRAEAEKAGMTISSWVRFILINSARKDTPEEKK